MLEFQEAEENLAHAREKVARVAVPFTEVTNWLKEAVRGYGPAQTNTNIRTNLEEFKQSVNFSDALAVMDELVAAETALQQLQKRKADLGLK